MRVSVLVVLVLMVSAPVMAQLPDSLWSRTYGGQYSEYCRHIEQTTDGGFILAGTTNSYGPQGTYADNFWLVKTDCEGDTLWTRYYGGTGEEICYSAQQTPDGGYVLAGTQNYGPGYKRWWLVKTDPNGDTLWTHTYGPDSSFCFCYSVQQTLDGGYILAGDKDNYYPMIVKTNADGDTLWTRIYEGTDQDGFVAVRQLSDSSYVVSGNTRSYSVGDNDFWIMKMSTAGDTIWTRTFGGANLDACTDLVLTNDGGFALAGYSYVSSTARYEFCLIRLDADGDSLWGQTYGGTSQDYCRSAIQTADGGFLLGGNTLSFGAGTTDYWVVKTNAMGDSVGSRTFGTAAYETGYSVAQTFDGYYVVAGEKGSGIYDIWLVKLGFPPSIEVQSPNGGETWHAFSYDTVRWSSHGCYIPVTIELNRNFPGTEWEVLAASTDDDGEEVFYITEPLSDLCRIRVSSVDGSRRDTTDADFSISFSQGFLALVDVAAPSTPITQWNVGTLECPMDSTRTFRLRNLGTEPILVYQPIEPASVEFTCLTDCTPVFTLDAGEMTVCEVTLSYDPSSDGTHRDTLLIQTNASNGVNGYLRIPLSGTQISTPVNPDIVITTEGGNARLSWDPVTVSIGDCPIAVTHYLVFYSPTLEGLYYYHGFTPDTTYLHYGVIHYEYGMYYHVIATTSDLPTLLSLPADGTVEESTVMARLRKR